jgi:hypothetical protein
MDEHEIKRHTKIRNDLSGKRFGSLTCIRPTGFFSHSARQWLCECDCGQSHIATANHLVSGNTISCGCSKRRYNNKNIRWKGFGEISGRYFTDLKRGASHRKLEFNLSIQDIWWLFLEQGARCKLTGVELKFAKSIKDKKTEQTASLDRIDPSKGYIKGNVQWVHQTVNFMKQDLTEEEFLNWCSLIVSHYTK